MVGQLGEWKNAKGQGESTTKITAQTKLSTDCLAIRAGPGDRVTPGDRATANTEEKPSLAGTAEYSKGSAKKLGHGISKQQAPGILGGERKLARITKGNPGGSLCLGHLWAGSRIPGTNKGSA